LHPTASRTSDYSCNRLFLQHERPSTHDPGTDFAPLPVKWMPEYFDKFRSRELARNAADADADVPGQSSAPVSPLLSPRHVHNGHTLPSRRCEYPASSAWQPRGLFRRTAPARALQIPSGYRHHSASVRRTTVDGWCRRRLPFRCEFPPVPTSQKIVNLALSPAMVLSRERIDTGTYLSFGAMRK
jgi:hypothetical protein